MYDEFDSIGQKFEAKEAGCFQISQPIHILKHEMKPSDVGFEKFRYIRSSLAWIYLTRPDFFCGVN